MTFTVKLMTFSVKFYQTVLVPTQPAMLIHKSLMV